MESAAPNQGPTVADDAAELTYEQRRSRRRRLVAKVTIHPARMPARELAVGRALYPPGEHADVRRPRVRADCVDGPRPCPFVACKHHLYLDVTATGSIVMNFPDVEPDELEETCSLDVADGGESTLHRTGELMNLTRERVRQMETRSLGKLRSCDETLSLVDLSSAGDGFEGRRHLPIIEQQDDLDLGEFDYERFSGSELDE